MPVAFHNVPSQVIEREGISRSSFGRGIAHTTVTWSAITRTVGRTSGGLREETVTPIPDR